MLLDWSSQLVPSILIRKYFLFSCLSLVMWLCRKKCSENSVLGVLLQIGAKDLTVLSPSLSFSLPLFFYLFPPRFLHFPLFSIFFTSPVSSSLPSTPYHLIPLRHGKSSKDGKDIFPIFLLLIFGTVHAALQQRWLLQIFLNSFCYSSQLF